WPACSLRSSSCAMARSPLSALQQALWMIVAASWRRAQNNFHSCAGARHRPSCNGFRCSMHTHPAAAFDTGYRAGVSADPAAPRELAQQVMAPNRALGVLLLALPHEVRDVVVLVGVLDESVV